MYCKRLVRDSNPRSSARQAAALTSTPTRQVVRTHGVEPWSRVYQTRALTIELCPSGNCGNRTHLSRFAKPTCHLDSPQKPCRIRTEPPALQAGSSPRRSGPRGWTSENRTQLAEARGLQPPLCPSTHPAEEGGVEPPAKDCPPLAGEVAPTGHIFHCETFTSPALSTVSRGWHERKVKESNPRPDDRHGFLDRLRTIPRYPPELLPQDSNLDQGGQSPTCYRYTREYWQRWRDSNPRRTVLETDEHNQRSPIL